MSSIIPGAMLGLLGGGQLGRMFTMAAQSIGYRVTVLDPAEECPAGSIAERHLCADYHDPTALHELSTTCAGVTTEFENVPADALQFLEQHCVVSPPARSVSIAQNRMLEKQFLAANGFSVAPFLAIKNNDDLSAEIETIFFPGILKVSQFGYDGKGQVRINASRELPNAFASLQQQPCVLEQLLPLGCEISVIVARGFDGEISLFPIAENQHVHGILDMSIVPARIPAEIAQQARKMAAEVAIKLDYCGVLCIEFFVLTDGRLLINEIAPRPHNSGHYTLDACITSQFEQQVRILCRLPQGSTALLTPVVMVNLLGDLWQSGEPAWSKVLRNPNAKLHLYGKCGARPGRKMGHFTVLADTVEQALQQAEAIKVSLKNR
ncbi:5-(carboxyamino)imidazole ribonucleotide synthase [Nitrosomonas sp. Is37]|uniref:5-(carboxyamino)imidazole ribonucleotide synthase n=1 Tax=Nitrosomonas sp. Is37 TaxID=3080535 RepID=UPI00294B6640|nr:5-(carboxyamino)imidazole ribonucleotide synthase [Nitrosomonas sp. Is37]MDV6345168.1 5-(carboxyamino)imidazole ribonucleotide synthase [Nitrosomonas sp. Is37]